MRLANLDGRAVLVTGDQAAVDVHKASDGRFGPGLSDVYDDWANFRSWADQATLDEAVPFELHELGAPSPEPRQVLAFGLNYVAHAAESGLEPPTGLPPTFTKFRSSLTGPVTEVTLPPGGNTDWEIELVAVIGKEATEILAENAWEHVAGLTVGQDLSERVTQLAGPAPQFGLGKSFAGFSPIGPWLVTPDELESRDDLALEAMLDGEVVQSGRTSSLIYSVAKLIEGLSAIITLYPGDIIFTGTPHGVGLGRDPQRFISAGQTLVSTIEGIGELRQTFVESPVAAQP